MKIKVIVTQITQTVREVEVDSMDELDYKLEDQGEWIGRCVIPAHSTELSGTVYNEHGSLVKKVNFDC